MPELRHHAKVRRPAGYCAYCRRYQTTRWSFRRLPGDMRVLQQPKAFAPDAYCHLRCYLRRRAEETRPMKTYIGAVTEKGDFGEVCVHRAGCAATSLHHHVLHSPTGFAWGYHGSGPADLARSILWDHLGKEPLPHVYQQFKVDVIGNLPQHQGWTVRSDDVDAWLDRKFPGRRNLVVPAGQELHD